MMDEGVEEEKKGWERKQDGDRETPMFNKTHWLMSLLKIKRKK